ncbi:hypothetical protein [Brevibacillus sp. SYSU BS000544]|uniref:hypothetical protein n=1 Tax=Brevibacillus sp. SYSU BS000544 TaxID=3416443 RepID=UPI003CE57D23
MQKMLFTCILFLVTLATLACSVTDPSQPIVKKQPEENMLHIEPIDLFAGEAAKFKPFLGTMAGAVKLKYTGDKKEIQAEVELWENGVRTKTLGSVGSLIQGSQEGKQSFEGEFIVSIKKEQVNENKPHFEVTSAIVDKDGSTASTIYLVDRVEKLTGLNSIPLNKSMDVSENSKVAVWGMQATDENVIETVELTPEGLQKVKWALVVTISLKN